MLSLQAVARAAHLAAKNAPMAACARSRNVSLAAVSDESAASEPTFYSFIMLLNLQIV